MINVDVAGELLDFDVRIKSPDRSRQQLEGAVALHNMLEKHGVAYLADEVGMGKTLVALGAVALFRHFDPRFRVLVIAPRENIQRKWAKELRVFAGENVRFPDLRVRGLGKLPARPMVLVPSLLALLRETSLDPERDFFARLPSFSFQMGKEDVDWDRVRDEVRLHLPWLKADALDLRGHRQRKDNLARALCCALPAFDLVIVDEAHNLKHGFKQEGSARNRVLGLAMGHPASETDLAAFPSYGVRARKVLFLSATPIEDNYRQLWNQLDVFGRAQDFNGLIDDDLNEDEKKEIASKFLIRRVTTLRSGGQQLTKNQYRREWRLGGMANHDQPIKIEDDRQRLTLALVQKKVSEVLGSESFNHRFQIGMLASFESFLETAKLKRSDTEATVFDDSEQTETELEKQGVDVQDINQLARSHRQQFGIEMPHPKMDALVADLARAWETGRKALVFVRRVQSVKELRAKLEESYDNWLIGRLKAELPEGAQATFAKLCKTYIGERVARDGNQAEEGGTFFSWFFHGQGPRGVISGANVQRRFNQTGGVYSTFFEDNDVAALLEARPGEVTTALARAVRMEDSELREKLRIASARFLGTAKKLARKDRFVAVQAAAIELLAEHPGPFQERAREVWNARFRDLKRQRLVDAPEIGSFLEHTTFFNELRVRPDLREALWPKSSHAGFAESFREQASRGQLLATAARLGHAFIDMYVMTVRRLGTMELGTQDETDADDGAINEYLDRLEQQRLTPMQERGWRAFDELSEIAKNFDLIVDVNIPELRSTMLAEQPRLVGDLLGQQHPISGMAGSVNQTAVRQFRMPGYPVALVTTDLLQEGEDLHPFCSSVYHYGISWTPSAMEQRTGRVDRVRSQTDRRLSDASNDPTGDDLLQVYFPHLSESVEVLQVRRVLVRMNAFLRLMHRGLGSPPNELRRLDIAKEVIGTLAPIERIVERLESAFPVSAQWLKGPKRQLAVSPTFAQECVARFHDLRSIGEDGTIIWARDDSDSMLWGTRHLAKRQQPFALFLRSHADRLLVRCVSPVGRVGPQENAAEVKAIAKRIRARVGAIALLEEGSYDLTVEEDVLLHPSRRESDGIRVRGLVGRVAAKADALELELLETDLPLSEFQQDLRREGRITRDL